MRLHDWPVYSNNTEKVDTVDLEAVTYSCFDATAIVGCEGDTE